ncbi:MAG: hypothetical protein JWR19_4563 [Pedosphaera sp.]|nr:hypothetical protein [Pedosphaera sp.]
MTHIEKKITSLLCILALARCALGAGPSFQWVREAIATNGITGAGIAVDTNGNSYVTGFFHGNVNFGETNLTNAINNDIFTAKYDALGNLLWVRQAGGSSDDQGAAVAVDAAGNVFVTGYFTGLVSFGTTNLTSFMPTSSDIFLAKYDTSGNLLWVQQAGGHDVDAGTSVAVDANGNCFIAGNLQGPFNFGTNGVNSAGCFVAGYDPTGALLWVRTSTGTGIIQATGVAVDSQGNVGITGLYHGLISFGTNQFNTQLPQGEVFTAKYAPDGTLLWCRTGTGTQGYGDNGTAIAADANGNFYVTGTFRFETAFDNFLLSDFPLLYPGDGGALNMPVYGNTFVVKYDSNGTVVWAQSVLHSRSSTGLGIAVNSGGDILVTGNGGDFVAGLFVFGTNFYAGFGIADMYIALFDSAGDPVSFAVAGGTGRDIGQGIAWGLDGNAYATGYFGSSGTFGGTNLTGGARNLFVTRVATGLDPSNPPIILRQPTNEVVVVGSNAIFSVGVLSAQPVTYQWRFNGVDLPQGTDSSLVLSSVLPAASGNYYLISSNLNGSVTSSVVHLQVEVPFDFVWAEGTGGTKPLQPTALAIDNPGNIYLAGYYQSNAVFGSIILTNLGHPLSNDMFVAKFDPAGNVLWAQQAGGIDGDQANALAVDGNGNVFVTGTFQATAKFGNITLTNTTSTPTNRIFIAKYDTDGNVLWAQQAGGNIVNQVNGMAVDAAGNVYITGFYQGNAVFGNTNLTTPIFTSKSFLAKYDTAGACLWATSLPASCDKVAVDDSGNILLVGHFFGQLVLGTNQLTNGNVYAVFTAKFDPVGNVLWARQSTNQNYGAMAVGIAVDHNGNSFVTGNFTNQISFGKLSYSAYNSSMSAFLVKYDPLGNPVWLQGGTPAFAQGSITSQAITLDGFGNPCITGAGNGARFGNPLAGPLTLPTLGPFVAKFSGTGDFLWARQATNFNTAPAYGVGVNSSNEVFLAGAFQVTTYFGGVTVPSSSGRLFLAKLGIHAPGFSASPTNQSAIYGANVILSAGATGTPPFSYQWRFNGIPIAGATNSTLQLVNVHAINAGSYTVVATNPSGTATSTGTSFTVIPALNAPVFDGSNLVITWPDTSVLQTSTNDVTGPYFDVPDATSPYTNLNTGAQQFFRLRN